jgi:tRNA threonylcarbamoyladenosine biosynthesis protein TsaB
VGEGSGAPRARLAVEAATECLGVALVEGDRVLARALEDERSGAQARRVLPMIQEILRAGGRALGDLEAFVVSRGPGSFTGIRIGLSTVQALAWPRRIPVIGASTLDAMACGAADEAGGVEGDLLLPLLDARKREVYAGLYRLEAGRARALSDPALLPPARLGELVAGSPDGARVRVFGRGLRRHEAAVMEGLAGRTVEALGLARDLPDPVALARSVRDQRARAGEPPEPIYLRRSEAEESWTRRHASTTKPSREG